MPRGREHTFFVAACIIGLTLLAYLPVRHAGFIWDDDAWLTENPAVVGPGGLARVWTSVERLQYYPLLYTAFRVEHRLWGLEPFGYHAVNVLLHAANALLVGLILLRLGLAGAWWVAAVFAVHPVHVESVAWVSELKNVLSGSLALGAVLAFVVHDERRGRDRTCYLLSLLLFAAAMLTKTAVAPLAVVLALVLVWRNGRLTRGDVVRLAPFFAVATALVLVTVRLESGMVERLGFDFELSLVERLAVASRALLFYPWKLAVPFPLIFNYPRFSLDESPLVLLAPAAVVALVAAGAAVLWRRGERGAALACAAYGALIAPVLGFFDVFYFRYSFVADHFQYLASIPVLVLLAGAARRLTPRGIPLAPRRVAAVGVVLVLAGLSWKQAQAYRDLPTLWRATIAKNPGSWFAHHGLGRWLLENGKPEEALVQLEAAVRAKPRSAESHTLHAMARARLGDRPGALEELELAVALDPLNPYARLERATQLVEAGRADEALADLAPFIGPTSAHLPALALRSRALRALGRWAEALEDVNRVIEIAPSGAAYAERAAILGELGQAALAMENADRALELEPTNAPAWVVRGMLWRRRGDDGRSCADWRRACELGDCALYARLCRSSEQSLK